MSKQAPQLLSALECVKTQLDGVINEAERMLGLEFPYKHSEDALGVIINKCRDQREYLLLLAPTSDPKTVETACCATADYISGTHDVLGFILRSTNTRNAFELYGPLLRLAKAFVGSHAKLLLSSEWSFSPFLLLSTQHLPPEYVLIGQPATESANPFIVPLAAHELGHSVWHNHKVLSYYTCTINDSVASFITSPTSWPLFKQEFHLSCDPTDLQTDLGGGRQIWMNAVAWCQRQMEELFCDLFGLRLFGTSYLHAFSYLLSPMHSIGRSPQYPALPERAEFHALAAVKYDYLVPDEYSKAFGKHSAPTPPADRYGLIVSAADAARKALAPMLIDKVDEIVSKYYPFRPTSEATTECVKAFHFLMPAQTVPTMADITNAAWQAMLSDAPFCASHLNVDKASNLVEVALKSFEIFELNCCIKDSS